MKITRFFEIAEIQTNVAVLKRSNEKALKKHTITRIDRVSGESKKYIYKKYEADIQN